jgi:tryptophan synthase alpha chain
VTELRSVTKLPIGVGFGISTPEQARQAASFADAVVVGSAISQLIENNIAADGLVDKVGEFAGALKTAMHGARAGATGQLTE